jgi:hypothetical protein
MPGSKLSDSEGSRNVQRINHAASHAAYQQVLTAVFPLDRYAARYQVMQQCRDA